MLNHQPTLDGLFRALADPTRRAMVDRLSHAPAAVSELAAPMSISLAAVMQHLQVLEQSGLVRTEKVGRTRTCRVDSAALSMAEKWLADRRALWERRLDRLGEVLTETASPRAAGRKKKRP